MTENVEILVLEPLRRLSSEFDAMALETSDIKSRLTSMDENPGLIRTDVGHPHTMCANQGRRLDRMEGRLGRIERRPDLVEEPHS
jgi:hypothetical protein